MRKYMALIAAVLMLAAVALGGCASVQEPVSWDGNYYSDNGYLVISDSTRKSFAFVFLMNDGKELRGMAEADGYEGDYGDLDFTLTGDTLVVTLDDDAVDAAGMGSFLGTYMMNNVGTMVDEGSPEELGVPEGAQEGEPAEEPAIDPAPAEEQPVVEQVPAEEQPVVDQAPAEEQPVVEPAPEAEQPVMEELPADELPVAEQ